MQKWFLTIQPNYEFVKVSVNRGGSYHIYTGTGTFTVTIYIKQYFPSKVQPRPKQCSTQGSMNIIIWCDIGWYQQSIQYMQHVQSVESDDIPSTVYMRSRIVVFLLGSNHLITPLIHKFNGSL